MTRLTQTPERTGEVEELRQRVALAEAAQARAEAALRQSEERFHAFLHHSPCVAFLKDGAGRIVYGNAGLDRLLSTPNQHFLGKTDYDLFPAEVADRLRANDATVLATGRTLETVELVPGPEGSLRSWLVMKFLVSDASGAPFLGGVAIDITERERAERELTRQNAILQSILDSMAEGVVVADTNGQFLLFNQAAKRMAGVGRIPAGDPGDWSAAFGVRLADGLTPFPADQLPLARAIRGEVVEAVDMYLENPEVPDGRWLSVTGRPLRDEHGRSLGGVVVFRDVTERRRAEEQLKQYAGQLRALSRQLLGVQEEERRRLARELHDEVGQVLTGLKLTLERAALQSAAERDTTSAKATRLVQELMGRVRGLSMNLRPSLLDDLGLLPALRWHVEQYQAQTGVQVALVARGLEWEDRMPPEVETAAYRVVQEALTNVARHARVSEVSVAVGRRGAVLYIDVEDAGAGFTPNAVAGTSGLSGMRERVELLGGTLAVQSEPRNGTRVAAQLPIPAGVGRSGSK